MFETEDWDLDQDFLNDVDDKADKYCSQINNQACEPKRRKIDNNDDSFFSNDGDTDVWADEADGKANVKQDESKHSRKNLILGLFNKNLPNKSISSTSSNDVKKSCDNRNLSASVNKVPNNQCSQLPRKNLILGILQKKSSQDNIENHNTKNIETNGPESKIKGNGNANLKKESVSNNKIRNKVSKNDSKSKVMQHSHKDSRPQLLCNTLKQSPLENVESRNDNVKCKTPMIESARAQPSKKMPLVRKFPGPAGLLPDDIDINNPCVSYLHSLEESEKTTDDTGSNDLPEYCSQATNNLFTEGAWQLMLDDLPNGFLNNYNITTIKQTASLNGFNGTKVAFLAGIIEHIDFNHDNPPLVLKDFSDSIRGIVHKDIPLKYPGLLEPNVVILLHDVGLLRTSGIFVSNKYQILISPSSLLAIYTSKGIVERTQHMDSVLKKISEGRTEEGSISTKLAKAHSSKIGCELSTPNRGISKESEKFTCEKVEPNEKESVSFSNLNKTNESLNESLDFDTDISFSVFPTKITDLQIERNFQNSTSKDLKKVKQENKKNSKQKEKIGSLLERFAHDGNGKKHLCRDSKVSKVDAGHSKSPDAMCKDEAELLNNVFFQKMDLEKSNINKKTSEKLNSTAKLSTTHRETLEDKQQRNKVPIRSRLMQFKNKDTLSPPEDSIAEKGCSGKPSETPCSTNNIMDNIENDSDDEMLSQLDMDTILSNYNTTS